jgi:3-hydroxyacyl-[acyl-carrier-protein] dehydratase
MTTAAVPLASLLARPVSEIIPQRPPFLLIDRVVDADPGIWAHSHYTVDAANPVFLGHFPDFKVLPGVLIVENMAQTACWTLAARVTAARTPQDGLYLLARVNQCSFSRMVRPGDLLVTEARLQRSVGPFTVFDCVARVGETSVARAELLVARTERPAAPDQEHPD